MARVIRRKKGVTLIEILVVIAVIALLAGLLIPAVSAARSAFRRAECANNLRQIGLALHAYEAVSGMFPTASSGPPSVRSFLVAILPQLEQSPLYDTINFQFDLAKHGGPNHTVQSIKLDVLTCPSDDSILTGWPSATNYAGNQGSGVQKYGENGVFRGLQAVRIRDISDGTSHTVAVSEWLIGPQSPEIRDPLRSVFQTPTRLIEPDQLDRFTESCRAVNPIETPVTIHPKGSNWFFGQLGYCLYNHVLTPGEKSCLNGTAYQQGAWTSGSFHGAGVNLLFADGRVQFLRSNVDLEVWRALASRNGREAVSVP
ncbi:DUF1559 domain-containing protein [Tautonia marina]|uniref:DUF1559 domain-containing protein n=1 Tax=Tautonia marina TaxID=2653855 RepID=UPI0012612E01|nr:DUF1559 domain-containing protein [Tautonia marina]